MRITWLKKSIRFYFLRHLILAGAVMVSAAILCAALMTGHSLHEGLQQNVLKRIGPFKNALYFPGAPVPSPESVMKPGHRAALLLKGELLDQEGRVCAHSAQIIGVMPETGALALSNAILNARARALLEGSKGSEASIRFKKPSSLSVEMPIADTKQTLMLRRSIQLQDNQHIRLDIPPDFALEPAT
jgi:hypothetical protein